MDAATRSEMESSFGADFGRVNIHTDAEAVQMSKELGAQAFTHGNDVYFNKGKYNPGSGEGKHLLAHELTHTIQQTGMVSGNLQFTIGDGHDLGAARFSGNAILEACLDNEQTLRQGSSGAAVTLIQQALVDAGFPLPRFGVDGSFGNETRTALQNFQRSSSLTIDGVVGPGSMSALDALFTGGVPSLPPAVPAVPVPGTPPVVTTQTIKTAPGGSSDTRTTVGVGERVRFTANTAGIWSASDGHFIGRNNGANIIWEAPAVAASPTITLTDPGGTRVTPFTVIAPNALSMSVANRHPIAAGTAGACMITNVVVNPLSVNFGRTHWFEVPGPATNVSGYFNRFPAATIFHNPNPAYLPFNDNNAGLIDHAAWHGVPAPFSFGTFEWVIPNRYKIDGEPDAQGRVFTNTVQAFTMFAGGTMMINKAGATVIRFINNTVF
jgi:peptidoglycan hydrolase-like protein with peptidoglycan-binding domain